LKLWLSRLIVDLMNSTVRGVITWPVPVLSRRATPLKAYSWHWCIMFHMGVLLFCSCVTSFVCVCVLNLVPPVESSSNLCPFILLLHSTQPQKLYLAYISLNVLLFYFSIEFNVKCLSSIENMYLKFLQKNNVVVLNLREGIAGTRRG